MEKSFKLLKAEVVNALYEETISGRLEWKEIGKMDLGRYTIANFDSDYTFYGWSCEINDLLFVLKKNLIGMFKEDKVCITIKGNEAESRIYTSDIEGIYVVNPVKALISALEHPSEHPGKTTSNALFSEITKIIKDKRKRTSRCSETENT